MGTVNRKTRVKGKVNDVSFVCNVTTANGHPLDHEEYSILEKRVTTDLTDMQSTIEALDNNVMGLELQVKGLKDENEALVVQGRRDAGVIKAQARDIEVMRIYQEDTGKVLSDTIDERNDYKSSRMLWMIATVVSVVIGAIKIFFS